MWEPGEETRGSGITPTHSKFQMGPGESCAAVKNKSHGYVHTRGSKVLF